ncbi:MAG: methionyl-tRNA formyltransferase [Clostridia bacterium]|nr:methionyl-tRNA formyltransferase [Clostridia bacterium]
MKVMFMGTPDIAVGCLEKLAEKYEVVCVVTQPDKPKNRGHKMSMPPVKEKAMELNIDVVQPVKLKDGSFLPVLEKYRPDIIAVIAYGRILPKYILDYPKYGCINVHASLLPKYRGAAPIQWSIVNGEKLTGITTMLMSEGLDTGDMLLKKEIPITDKMTGGELHDEIARLCPSLLIETIENLDLITPQKQDDSLSSYAPMIEKSMTVIDWNKSPKQIVDLVRGMNPLHAARTSLNGKLIKVYSAEISDKSGENGAVIANDSGITVGCDGGSVRITELQPEGKRRMSADEYMLGHKVEIGVKFI